MATNKPQIFIGKNKQDEFYPGFGLAGGQSLCLVGDSILDNYTQTFKNDTSGYKMSSGIAWANARLGWPFNIIPPNTDSGGNIQNVTAKVPYYANSINAEWVMVNAGANSVDQSTRNLIEDWNSLFGALEQGNHKIIAMNILPQGSVLPVGAAWNIYLQPAEIADLVACNEFIKNYCEANGHVYIDAYSALVAKSGLSARDYTLGDYKHPSNIAGYIIGEVIYEALKDRTDLKPLKHGIYPEYNNIGLPGYTGEIHELAGRQNANPTFQGTGGSSDANVNGEVANNWRITRNSGTGSAQASKVLADPEDIDQTNWQRVKTNGTGTVGVKQGFEIINQHTTALFTPLDYVEGYCELRVDIGEKQLPFNVKAVFTGGTPSPAKTEFVVSSVNPPNGTPWIFPGGGVDGLPLTIKLAPIQIPVDSTGVYLQVAFNCNGEEVKTIDVRNFSVYRINPPTREIYRGERTIALTGDQDLEGYETRYESYVFTGALAGAATITLPMRNSRLYTITNQTDQNLNFTTENGNITGGIASPVVLAATKTAILKCDGTNIVRVTNDA
tara:strand:+ start:1210 stop:2877 length:1668 start_codon:yes stop_codon:yes gene_type:complete